MLIYTPIGAHCQIIKDSTYSSAIKSVFLNRSGIELETPRLMLGSSDQLVLRFDELTDHPNHFRYRISHCNINWESDTLKPEDFINGFEEGNIDNYQFSFTTLQSYVNYYQSIPATYSNFIASGNYKLEVFLQEFPDSIILTRRFMVYEDLLNIEASIVKPVAAIGNKDRDQELTVAVSVKEGSYLSTSSQYLKVIAQQNGRVDLVRLLPFSGYVGDQMMYRWKDENVFPGGNCFRYFDISNIRTPMYNVQQIKTFGGETSAFLQPEEDRSRKNYSVIQSLNGGMKVNIWNRDNPQIEADYVWVNFSLPMVNPRIDGNFYIVGQITNWLLNEDSRLEWQSHYHAYTKRLLLKQGYYSYQLLFLPIGDTVARTSTLEGDHYETPNTYTIFVYLRYPNDRYDRLVGVQQCQQQ